MIDLQVDVHEVFREGAPDHATTYHQDTHDRGFPVIVHQVDVGLRGNERIDDGDVSAIARAHER